jgi:two-component system chemotaxis family response regulator WspR
VRQYRANAATRNVPVLVLSSREEATMKQEAFAAGANDYLVKIPDKIELLARVRYHTMAYISRQQRDEAYHALRQSQRELLEANFELQRLMNVDGLTGINNRRRFDEYATVEWRRAEREQLPFALLLADVDSFKAYNDTYGHLAGDDALKRIAEVVRSSCKRPADLPARFGGEEFALVLPGTDASGITHIAETFRRAVFDLAIPHRQSAVSDRVTISVGGTVCVPQEGDALIDCIHRADRALYEAKSGGRNRIALRTSA